MKKFMVMVSVLVLLVTMLFPSSTLAASETKQYASFRSAPSYSYREGKEVVNAALENHSTYSSGILKNLLRPGRFSIKISKTNYIMPDNIEISWTKADRAKKYSVTILNPSTNNKVYETTVNATKKDIGFLPSGMYKVFVTATNSYGSSISSNLIYFHVKVPVTHACYFANSAWKCDRLFICPVAYPRVTSPYGERDDPFNPSVQEPHRAIDIRSTNSKDLRILAVANGTIVDKYTDKNGAICLVILHDNGFVSVYAHLQCYSSSVRNAVEGKTRVKQGQVIGTMGMTGKTTGVHLHFELRNKWLGSTYSSGYKDTYVNPSIYIPELHN